MAYILNKNHLSFWLRQLKTSHELIAPMRDVTGDIVLTELTRMHETALDGPALMPSPKEFLLPQMEQLFCWSEEGIEEAFNKKPRVLFGIRSCDLSAIAILDRFYLANNKDAYYETRRKKTAVITIACNQPDPTCFCLGLGTGPFLKTGYDLQLTDLGDRFLVETGSETGAALIRDYSYIFTEPGSADNEDLYETRLASQSRFEKRVNLEQVRKRILSGAVKDSLWEWVAERCFECGGCVYNCPVCTCFNVLDRPLSPDSGKRMRIWDTCMFKGFTRMAGGAVPAKNKMVRTKRWFHHKLIHWPEQFGAFGCVGCGRCAVSCPGKIDMATVALKIKGSDQVEEK
ncbi:MAG TPA: 4Fe-4S dicluster domain-containing protein [Nitrospirota bacterium]|nr:4Fe-4S dicluster domain-containing protein [Nitrospirota bacterium]